MLEHPIRWLIDLQLAAAIAYLIVWALHRCMRQPARRLLVSWATLSAVLLFAVLSLWAFPNKSSTRLFALKRPDAVVAPIVGSTQLTTATGARSFDLERPALSVGADNVGRARERQAAGALFRVHSGALRWVMRGYGLATVGVALWLVYGAWLARSIVLQSRPGPARLRRLVGHWSAPSPAPRLLISEHMDQPIALGCWQPTIILPTRALNERPAAMRAIVAHELSHIHHGDLRLLLLARFVMLLTFANPGYWILRRQIRRDQEILADAAATRRWHSISYAKWLVRWSSERAPITSAVGAASISASGFLRQRVAHILNEDQVIEHTPPRYWHCLAFIPALCIASLGARFTAVESTTIMQPSTPTSHFPARLTAASASRIPIGSGVHLELLGVRLHPCSGDAEWSPDGTLPAGAAGIDAVGATEIIVGVINPRRVPFEWLVDPYDLRVLTSTGEEQRFALTIPDLNAAADFRFAAAVGHWETRHQSSVPDDRAYRYSPCDDWGDDTIVTVNHPLDENIRIIAVDQAGCQHAPAQLTHDKGEVLASFADLPVEYVDRFCVQSRPQTWVEFRDISLIPGQKTNARLLATRKRSRTLKADL